jgi:hypothetical protein
MPQPLLWAKTPEETAAFWADLRSAEGRRAAFQQAANAAVAQSVGTAYQRMPYADPGVTLAVGTAAANGQVDLNTAAQAVDQHVAAGNRPAWSGADSTGQQQGQNAQNLAVSGPSDKLIKNPDGTPDWAATLKAAGVPAHKDSGFDWTNPFEAVTNPTGLLDEGMSAARFTTRTGLSAAQSSWEEVQNRGAQAFHQVGNITSDLASGDLAGAGKAYVGALAQATPFGAAQLAATGGASGAEAAQSLTATNVGQQFQQAHDLGSIDLGSGWFPSGTVTNTWQPAQARQVRGVIPGTEAKDANGNVIPGTGQAWTFGRQAASVIAQPGTKQYGIMSGFIDGAAQFAFDPSLALQDAAMVSRGTQLFEAAGKAEQQIPEAEKILAGAAAGAGAAGEQAVRDAAKGVLIDAERNTINATNTDAFLNHSSTQPFLQHLADSNDALDIARRLGPQAPPSLIAAVQQTHDIPGVAGALKNELGLSIATPDQLPGLSFGYDLKQQVIHAIGDSPSVARQVGSIPDRVFEGFLPGANDFQQRATLNATDDWLKLVKADYTTRSTNFGKMAQGFASGSAEGRFQALTAWADSMRSGLVALGMPDDVAKQTMTLFKDRDWANFWISKMALPADADAMAVAGDAADLHGASPAMLSQELGSLVTMPDPREIRRLTSKYGRLISSVQYDEANNIMRAKNLKFPLSAVQTLGEDVFPKMAIGRAATALRVTMDEQLRLMAVGAPNMITHPIQWLGLVLGSNADLERLGMSHETAQEMTRQLGGTLASSDSSEATLRYTRATGMWDDVGKDQPQKYVDGSVDVARQFANDPIGKQVMQGQSTDQIIDWLHQPENSKTFKQYQELADNAKTRDPTTGKITPMPLDLTDDNILRGFIDRNIRANADAFAGDNAELRKAIGYNLIGDKADAGEINPETGATIGAAFDNGGPTEDLKRMLQDHMTGDQSPEKIKYNTKLNEYADPETIKDQWNRASRWWFSKLFDLPVRTLTRSPFFRDEFYQRVAELAPHLAPEEANSLLKSIEAGATEQGFGGKVSEWLGGDKRLDDVIAGAKQANGTLSLDDVFNYAKGHGIDTMHDLLYDVSRRSNMEQSLRIVAPFANAWRQIATDWIKILGRNPGFIRRAQMTVQGARGSGFFYTDPNTGKESFNYPMSDWVVNALTGGGGLPGEIARTVATGGLNQVAKIPGASGVVGAVPVLGDIANAQRGGMGGNPLRADVAGLNLVSSSFIPSLGPVIAMPLAEILKNKPWADDIRGMLMPYGVPSSENSPALGDFGAYFEPGWMQKIQSAITTSPDSSSSYGNTYSQTLEALASTGKYGNSAASRAQLIEDAKAKARVLTVLRGLGQFTVPSSPSYDPTIATQDGDHLMSYLSQDAHHLQAADYNTWVQNFINAYGEGPFIAAQSRTRTAQGGLDASAEFGHWEQGHQQAMSTYKDVAGYFAPVGSDFDSEVYQRQLTSGERTKLSADEMLNASQATVAKWKYDQAKVVLGAHPTLAQQNWLVAYKNKLQQDYPGYAIEPAVTVANLPTKIEQLNLAVRDSQLKGDVQTAAATYLHLRDQALQVAQSRTGHASASLAGVQNADLRAWLSGAATQIVAKYPLFSRLYDSVLSNEVDQ